MLRNSYRIRNNDVRMARISVTLVVACFMAHATPSITGDSGHSEISEERLFNANKLSFRKRKKVKRKKISFDWFHDHGFDGSSESWGERPDSVSCTGVDTEFVCEVMVRTRDGRTFEEEVFFSDLGTEGMSLADLISTFARREMGCKAYYETFDEGEMLIAFGEDEDLAHRSGGYVVKMTNRDGCAEEPLNSLGNYDATDYVRVVVEWTDYDPEKLQPVDDSSCTIPIGKRNRAFSIIVALASLSIIPLGELLDGRILSGLAIPFLVGSYEWTFRKSIQMETYANPSTQRAFERLGPVQSFAGDPFQNIGDAIDGSGKPAEARVSIWDGEHSLPAAKASNYTNGLQEHIAAVKDGAEISQKGRLDALEGDMAHLNLECFNTVGLEGSEQDSEIPGVDMGAEAEKKLRGNRFFWFFRSQNVTSDDQNRRGSWGEGKFTLESASLLGAHISLSVRNTASGLSRVLMGLTTLRWHPIYKPSKGYGTTDKFGKVYPDKFAPYGSFSRSKKGDTGEGYAPMPIIDDGHLDQFSEDFRLERKEERGLSTVIMQPRDELRDPAIIARAIIARWWVAIIEGLLVVKIYHNGESVYVIDASSLRKMIEVLDWDSEPEKIGSKNERNPAKLSVDQWNALLDLHTWAENPPSEAVFETAVAGDEKATGKPTWHDLLTEEQTDSIKKRGMEGRTCMVRLRTWVHQIGSKPQIGNIEYVFKPANQDLQAQVYTRRGMTIPFISQIDGYISIVRCDGNDNLLESLLRDSEGPAHLEWSGGAQRVGLAAEKWDYGKSTVTLAADGLRSIKNQCNALSIEDHEWAEGFFIEIEGDKEPPKERRCKTCSRLVGQCICKCPVCGELKTDCNGHKTPDFVGVPTSMPDGKVRIMNQGSFSGAGRTIKVRLAYERGRGSPFSGWDPNDFNHNDINHDGTGATVKSVTSKKGDKDTGGVEVTLLIVDDDFEVLMWGWEANRDVRVRIMEVF